MIEWRGEDGKCQTILASGPAGENPALGGPSGGREPEGRGTRVRTNRETPDREAAPQPSAQRGRTPTESRDTWLESDSAWKKSAPTRALVAPDSMSYVRRTEASADRPHAGRTQPGSVRAFQYFAVLLPPLGERVQQGRSCQSARCGRRHPSDGAEREIEAFANSVLRAWRGLLFGVERVEL